MSTKNVSSASSGEASGVGVVDDRAFDLHRATEYHPERPERLRAARAAISRAALDVRAVSTRPATAEELARVHTEAYVEELRGLAGRSGQLDADTYLSPDSVAAAERAAGGGVALVDALLDGAVSRGVALLRPPGHHARPGQAMGFCLLNNVAVAAAAALSRGVRRVVVVDWDVHHGNGTQEMFYEDPRVLYVSLHQWPLYPGTGRADEVGEGDGRGFNVNVPLSPGAQAADYQAAFERVILPIVGSYAPELVLVSAGFDAHRDDPLASMRLDDAGYAWMTARLLEAAERTAGGKLGLFLEGGYSLSALETSLFACLEVVARGPSASAEGTASRMGAEHEIDVERARKALAPYWPALR